MVTVSSDTAIIVPTMGTRPELLEMCIRSIRAAGCGIVHVVIPEPEKVSHLLESGQITKVVEDPREGLAAAINAGIASLPETVLYTNWLGDDDLVTPDSIRVARDVLELNPRTSLAFGACEYINAAGDVIFRSKSGRWAPLLMYVGPQMVPQPGSLFRVADFRAVGGLDNSYKYAFDLDLLMKLRSLGRFRYINQTLSKFRWHSDSLSVVGRSESVNEASNIRRKHLPPVARQTAVVWEPLLKRTILWAGGRVTRRASEL